LGGRRWRSFTFGAVGLNAAPLSGLSFDGSGLAVARGPLGTPAVVQDIGAAFVRDGGALVLGGGAAMRGNGVGEADGGGLLGGDDVVVGSRLARTQPHGTPGEVGATGG
jgi:hypothetical protein